MWVPELCTASLGWHRESIWRVFSLCCSHGSEDFRSWLTARCSLCIHPFSVSCWQRLFFAEIPNRVKNLTFLQRAILATVLWMTRLAVLLCGEKEPLREQRHDLLSMTDCYRFREFVSVTWNNPHVFQCGFILPQVEVNAALSTVFSNQEFHNEEKHLADSFKDSLCRCIFFYNWSS